MKITNLKFSEELAESHKTTQAKRSMSSFNLKNTHASLCRCSECCELRRVIKENPYTRVYVNEYGVIVCEPLGSGYKQEQSQTEQTQGEQSV